MEKQVTSTAPPIPDNAGGGGVWTLLFTLLITCRRETSNYNVDTIYCEYEYGYRMTLGQ